MKKTENIINENLTQIFINAEKSVQGIKDLKLREIAFARALDVLINDLSGPSKTRERTKGKHVKVKSINPQSEQQIRKDGPLNWIREIAEEDFFKEPKSSTDVLDELSKRSHRLKHTDITLPLQKLCHKKILRRNKQKANNGDKAVFHWYNW